MSSGVVGQTSLPQAAKVVLQLDGSTLPTSSRISVWPARVGGVNATQPVSGLQPQVARYMRYCNNGVLFPTGTSFTIADVQALNPEGQVRDRMGFFCKAYVALRVTPSRLVVDTDDAAAQAPCTCTHAPAPSHACAVCTDLVVL